MLWLVILDQNLQKKGGVLVSVEYHGIINRLQKLRAPCQGAIGKFLDTGILGRGILCLWARSMK